jgi:hypothetical protein
MGGERKVYRVLVGKPKRKGLLGRPRHRWENGIRMDLGDIGCGSVEWTQLAEDRGGGKCEQILCIVCRYIVEGN